MKFKEMNGLFPDKTRKYIKGLCQILKERRFDLIKYQQDEKHIYVIMEEAKTETFGVSMSNFIQAYYPENTIKLLKIDYLRLIHLAEGLTNPT